MGKIIAIVGRNGSGKDTINNLIMKPPYSSIIKPELSRGNVKMYTTRARRDDSDDAVYEFVTESQMLDMYESGEVLEYRKYDIGTKEYKYYLYGYGRKYLSNTDKDINIMVAPTFESINAIKERAPEIDINILYLYAPGVVCLERMISREKTLNRNDPKLIDVCQRCISSEHQFSIFDKEIRKHIMEIENFDPLAYKTQTTRVLFNNDSFKGQADIINTYGASRDDLCSTLNYYLDMLLNEGRE